MPRVPIECLQDRVGKCDYPPDFKALLMIRSICLFESIIISKLCKKFCSSIAYENVESQVMTVLALQYGTLIINMAA